MVCDVCAANALGGVSHLRLDAQSFFEPFDLHVVEVDDVLLSQSDQRVMRDFASQPEGSVEDRHSDRLQGFHQHGSEKREAAEDFEVATGFAETLDGV